MSGLRQELREAAKMVLMAAVQPDEAGNYPPNATFVFTGYASQGGALDEFHHEMLEYFSQASSEELPIFAPEDSQAHRAAALEINRRIVARDNGAANEWPASTAPRADIVSDYLASDEHRHIGLILLAELPSDDIPNVIANASERGVNNLSELLEHASNNGLLDKAGASKLRATL